MESKHIEIINPTETSNVLKKKEKKMRVQTHTWNLDDFELCRPVAKIYLKRSLYFFEIL